MATNSTTYYNLPVFAATDQPKWLVDWNTSMEVIDGAIAQAKAAGDNAQTTANANASAISGLSDSVSTMSTALGTLTTNVTTVTGNVQRINELIGNGTPTTQDKTIIGAINELKAEIDALAPGGAVSAAEVSYDNTTSGLTADDVQEAIDEVDAKIGFPTRLNQGAPQYSADGGLTWANFSGALSVDEVDNATVSLATGHTGSYGADSLTGTETYTFQSSHDEVLIVANSIYYATSGGAGNTTTEATVSASIPGKTVTQFHNQSDVLIGSTDTTNTNYLILDRNTFHVENVEAGDVITFSFAGTGTSVANSKLEGSYDIFTVN